MFAKKKGGATLRPLANIEEKMRQRNAFFGNEGIATPGHFFESVLSAYVFLRVYKELKTLTIMKHRKLFYNSFFYLFKRVKKRK